MPEADKWNFICTAEFPVSFTTGGPNRHGCHPWSGRPGQRELFPVWQRGSVVAANTPSRSYRFVFALSNILHHLGTGYVFKISGFCNLRSRF
eukprot:g16562.t1